MYKVQLASTRNIPNLGAALTNPHPRVGLRSYSTHYDPSKGQTAQKRPKDSSLDQKTSLERLIGAQECTRLFDTIERIKKTNLICKSNNSLVRGEVAQKNQDLPS